MVTYKFSISSNLINLAQTARNADPESLQSIISLKQAASEVDNKNSISGGCAIY
jgi:hypothetical protein